MSLPTHHYHFDEYNMFFIISALTITVVGVGLFYLSYMPYPSIVRRQHVITPLRARTGAVVLWLISTLFFCQIFSSTSAIFTQIMLIMLFLSLVPFSALFFNMTPRSDKKSIKQKPGRHPRILQAHWWSKTVIGCLLGLTLAVALSGIFAWWGPGGMGAPNKVQFNMWLITPLWLLAFSLVYFCRSGQQAAQRYVALNIIAYVILIIARSSMQEGV
jgi:hypothetical protein